MPSLKAPIFPLCYADFVSRRELGCRHWARMGEAKGVSSDV